MRKLTLLFIVACLFVGALEAQIPSTPAGRQFSAWQSGGYDVKKLEESGETRLVVLAQERGPAQQFVRITFNVGATEPYTF